MDRTERAHQAGLTISPRAAARIAALLAEEENRGLFLRLAVFGGGCQGFQYSSALDDERREDDHVFERDGAVLVVDEVSLGLLAGAEVDHVEDLVAAYFTVRNPNARSTCGCGNSFALG